MQSRTGTCSPEISINYPHSQSIARSTKRYNKEISVSERFPGIGETKLLVNCVYEYPKMIH